MISRMAQSPAATSLLCTRRCTSSVRQLSHFVGRSNGAGFSAEYHRTARPDFEMDTLNRRRNTLLAGAALVSFAFVYYSLIYRYGLNLADEGNVGLISQRLMRGERPFLDISPGYNVLWFYPISTLFRLFGTNLLLMRAYFYGMSTASGLIAFLLLRRLDAPLWLAFVQGLVVFSVTGQYFKAYIPFLVLSNLFAITLFLTSQRKALLGVGTGLLLGTTYLIRIDMGIFLTVVWFGVILLHALLLDRRVRLNLIVAGNVLLGVAVMHLPFIYDAYHRHFLQPFAEQYSDVAALILKRSLPQPTQMVANGQGQTGVAPGHTPGVTVVENTNAKDQTGAHGPTPAVTVVENHRVTVDKPATFLRRRAFVQIFQKSPRIEYRLLAFLTYIPALVICALLLAGLYLGLSKRMAVDRWVLFSALLTGCLAAFPQFFFFRPDLPHLIEFMNGGLVALTCAGWLLWSSQGGGRISTTFLITIALVGVCYLLLTLPNQYGGTLAIRADRHTKFRGANGVDVFLTKAEYEEANTLFSATVCNSTKKDYVVSYPYLPGVNFITARRTFQALLFVDNVTGSQDWQQSEIAKIRMFRPAVIVIDDWPINGTEESRFSHWATQMIQFIDSHYRLVASVKNKRVFGLSAP